MDVRENVSQMRLLSVRISMSMRMSMEFECVVVWGYKSECASSYGSKKVHMCVNVCACMKESKRHSQGAVSREPGSRLITELQCVWSLPGTDSFSPHGNPFPSPLLSFLHHPFSISFLFILHLPLHSISFPVLPPHPIWWKAYAEAHLCSPGTVSTSKTRLCSVGNTPAECVSVNTDMMSCHLS